MASKESRRRKKSEPWTFTRTGSFGTFTSAGSLPIEYLQTTFAHNELNFLTLARDVSPEDLDFEMLMQRDIDEDRARGDLKEYLNPKGASPSEMELYSVFFPPLLIACVPCRDNRIELHYPDESWEPDETRLIRRWGDMFQLEFYTQDLVRRLQLDSPDSKLTADVDIADVEAKFNLSGNSQLGAKLIAIDGQHRLYALKELADHGSGVIEKLVVPACVLFCTSATLASESHFAQGGRRRLPNVPETFRKVFVDVNSKMERVGAHTNILLNDTSIGSLIVREFCKLVNEEGLVNLSVVEWNVRSTKDSTILTKSYSLASVGIIEKALRECFARSETLIQRLLDIQEASIAQDLNDVAEDPDNPGIAWESFSIAQRRILSDRARKGIVQLLFEIFFGLKPFAAAFDKYSTELEAWAEMGDSNISTSRDYRKAHECLTTFKPPMDKSEEFNIVQEFERRHKAWRDEELCPVIGLALFHRSMILTLRDLMDALQNYGIQAIGRGLKELLGHALDDEMNLFGKTRFYAFKSIWQDELGVVVNRETTRRQFSRLTQAVCGNARVATDVAKKIETDPERVEAVSNRLRKLGEEKASEYWKRFVSDRETHFARTYLTNLALDQSEIDKLKAAKAQQDVEIEAIKRQELDEDEAKRPFDLAVRQHLRNDFVRAEKELRQTLQFESAIVGADSFEDDLDDE